MRGSPCPLPQSSSCPVNLYSQEEEAEGLDRGAVLEPRNRIQYSGFPCSSLGKESACSAGDQGSIPGSGRYPGEGNGNPLQYPCLGNPMDRGVWQAIVHGVPKSRTQLND